jgi:hypothetical protein
MIGFRIFPKQSAHHWRGVGMTSAENDFWALHRRLARFNRHRLNPRFPTENWRHELATQHENIFLENEILEIERCLIAQAASLAPCNVESFLEWFGTLKSNGPGQNSMLFDWLAEFANVEQMRWFIQQEVAGEAGFEDLTAMTQVKIPTRAKLEMARNYWDEMGRGREIGMHGPMLSRVAQEFGLNKIESAFGDDLDSDIDDVVPQVLALGNLMTGMAMNRHYTYHSVGALGAIELTAPLRAKKVYEGLKRLDVSR